MSGSPLGRARGSGKGGALGAPSLGNRGSRTGPIQEILTKLGMGWIGEEDDARAGGYSACSHHGIHELRVEGYITGPYCVTGIIAAENNSTVAVVVVLVSGVDDD